MLPTRRLQNHLAEDEILQQRGSIKSNQFITLDACGEVLGLGVARENPNPNPGPPPPLPSGPANPERASPAGIHLQQTPVSVHLHLPRYNTVESKITSLQRQWNPSREARTQWTTLVKWREVRWRPGRAECVPGGGGGGGGGRGEGSAPRRPSRPPKPSVRGWGGWTVDARLAGDGSGEAVVVGVQVSQIVRACVRLRAKCETERAFGAHESEMCVTAEETTRVQDSGLASARFPPAKPPKGVVRLA